MIWGLILDRSKRFFFSPKCPIQLRDPHSFLFTDNWVGVAFSRNNMARA